MNPNLQIEAPPEEIAEIFDRINWKEQDPKALAHIFFNGTAEMYKRELLRKADEFGIKF